MPLAFVAACRSPHQSTLLPIQALRRLLLHSSLTNSIQRRNSEQTPWDWRPAPINRQLATASHHFCYHFCYRSQPDPRTYDRFATNAIRATSGLAVALCRRLHDRFRFTFERQFHPAVVASSPPPSVSPFPIFDFLLDSTIASFLLND